MPAQNPQNSATRETESYFQAALNATATRTYRTAVGFHLSSEDREDLRQDLILDLIEHEGLFDPTKGGVGTFTGVVSEHRTADFLNARKKDRSRLVFCSGDEAANDPDSPAGAVCFTDNVVPLWADDPDIFSDRDTVHDLEIALAYMTTEQRSLFDLLESHQDLPSACKASGSSTATFYRRVDDLQMHLRMFGFRSDYGSPHVTPLRKIPASPRKNIHTPQPIGCSQQTEIS